jgi:hypothetical protein
MPKYDVFLSHSNQDKPAVELLARRLIDEAGLQPFLDKWHLIPGEPWQEALEEALDASHSCAVFLGPEGLGTWENEEMRAALDIRASRSDFRVIPVLLPGARFPDREQLPRFLARLTWVHFYSGLDDATAFQRLVCGIRGIAPGPEVTAEEFKKVYITLQGIVPQDVRVLDQLVWVLQELGRFHELLNEWKEVHNLLQECITSLTPLKSELESALEYSDRWRKASGLRLWGPCRVRLRQLESFAGDIKYIDKPFFRGERSIRGPSWMIRIVALRDDLEACLKEGNPGMIYDLAAELWDTCYECLYVADKRLRDTVGELHLLSNTILGSVENGKHNG